MKQFLERGSESFLPNLSIDIVIIGYQENRLKCLLLRIGDKWLLPGGYILKAESVDHAAMRILRERTGLGQPHLRFLSVFGDRNRRFGAQWREYIERSGQPWRPDYWVSDRFVSLAYYSLVHIEETQPVIGEYDDAYEWFPMDDLPPMWMDHEAIVGEARNRLRQDIAREKTTYNLLPEPFTMPQLHELHQVILDEPLERSRFQKKMLASGLFERLPKLRKDTPGRNPYQYRFKPVD